MSKTIADLQSEIAADKEALRGHEKLCAERYKAIQDKHDELMDVIGRHDAEGLRGTMKTLADAAQRQKGFVGGIVFVVSGIGVAAGTLIGWLISLFGDHLHLPGR